MRLDEPRERSLRGECEGLKILGESFSLTRRPKGKQTSPSSGRAAPGTKALDFLPGTPRHRAKAFGRELKEASAPYQEAQSKLPLVAGKSPVLEVL